MISRVNYIMHLKSYPGQQYWPGFNTVAGDVPLVYFTDSASYAINPYPFHDHMIRPVDLPLPGAQHIQNTGTYQ